MDKALTQFFEQKWALEAALVEEDGQNKIQATMETQKTEMAVMQLIQADAGQLPGYRLEYGLDLNLMADCNPQ